MSQTLFQPTDSVIHRLNPLTKLVALLSILVIVFASGQWWVSAALALVVAILAVLAGVAASLARVSSRILLPILIVLVLVQGLTFPGETVLLALGPLAVTSEGLSLALLIGARLGCLVLASVLFVLTTQPGTLLTALTSSGMSPKFAYLIAATLQLIPSFQERGRRILLAQQARGFKLPRNPLRRATRLMPLIAPLVLGMFTDAEDRSMAMEARAFGSTARRTCLEPVPDSRAQLVARWLMPLAALTFVVVPMLLEVS